MMKKFDQVLQKVIKKADESAWRDTEEEEEEAVSFGWREAEEEEEESCTSV